MGRERDHYDQLGPLTTGAARWLAADMCPGSGVGSLPMPGPHLHFLKVVGSTTTANEGSKESLQQRNDKDSAFQEQSF